jgi:hypothetical protein
MASARILPLFGRDGDGIESAVQRRPQPFLWDGLPVTR